MKVTASRAATPLAVSIQPADEPLILELFTRAEFRTIANAGHWVHTDAPEEFLRLTREFLG